MLNKNKCIYCRYYYQARLNSQITAPRCKKRKNPEMNKGWCKTFKEITYQEIVRNIDNE